MSDLDEDIPEPVEPTTEPTETSDDQELVIQVDEEAIIEPVATSDITPEQIPQEELPPLPKSKSIHFSDNFLSQAHQLENSAADDEPYEEPPTQPATAEQLQEPEEDLNEEEEDTDEIMDANHPLMQRVQEAIYQQLSKHIAKLELEIREKEEAAKKHTATREEYGVDLYNLQQQLARAQAMLEQTDDNYNVIKGLREEADRQLKHTSHEYQKEQEKLKAHENNLEQHKSELDKISKTLKQVDLYNEELRSKILVAKRTTLKAEKDLLQQELEKKRQDFFIDHLNEQLTKLQEKRDLYESQLQAQQRETNAAVETLQNAATEMEAIKFEKRQLVNQWKSSLIGLSRREEIMREIEKLVIRNNEILTGMQSELNGYKRAIRNAQEDGENLTAVSKKLESETEYIRRQIFSLGEQKDKMSETHALYSRSLAQAEQEMVAFQQERAAIQAEINAVNKAMASNTLQMQKMEKELAEKLQSQLAIQSGTKTNQREGQKLRQMIHEKESVLAQVENELGNIQLEVLNATHRIQSMKQTIQKIDAEILEKNKLIEKYENEIRRCNDELSKKASEIDALNKKYEQVTGGNDSAHMGTLEATIHNLTKNIQKQEQESLELQRFWLQAQNEMVSMISKSNEITEEIQNLNMRLTVLNRKKMVVNNQFKTEENEIKEHNRNIRKLQIEMVKVNNLLSKQSNICGQLEESNLELEQMFRAKLKEAEVESLHMEAHLENLQKEKEQALKGLVESERQMMLWEKKIQLAKETQAALDPNVGATEIREMSLEIHRMTLRYASMLKLQEKMIAEMEKSVYRRDSISSKGKLKGKGAGQLALQKSIAELKKKIKATVQDVQECDRDIGTLQQSMQMMETQIQESKQAVEALKVQEMTLEREFVEKQAKKASLLNETQVFQKLARRYQDLKDKKYAPLCVEESRPAELEKAENRIEKVKVLLESLNDTPITVKLQIDELGQFLKNTVECIRSLS